MVAESEEVGVATNIKLKTQTEQLKNISLDVATVEASMKDANKLLRQVCVCVRAHICACLCHLSLQRAFQAAASSNPSPLSPFLTVMYSRKTSTSAALSARASALTAPGFA